MGRSRWLAFHWDISVSLNKCLCFPLSSWHSWTPTPSSPVKNSLLLPASKALSLSRTPGEAFFLFPWLGHYNDSWLDFLKSYNKWTAMASARMWINLFQYHEVSGLKKVSATRLHLQPTRYSVGWKVHGQEPDSSPKMGAWMLTWLESLLFHK